MMTFLLGLALIGGAMVGLASGLLVGRGPLKGSCGGVSCGDIGGCAACPRARKARKSR